MVTTPMTTYYELLFDREVPEINSRARLYRHIQTGTEVLSLENDDENKVFGITFRTAPTDSTGIAHILEHSVLCGSRKYPSKEPFVELIKGSLNTFLNAFTFPDKTCYPVASQNVQDFYNLIDVYLDSVFYPRLTPEIFAQEGWHYHLEEKDRPMVFKGIVFNEMKGAYSSPESLLSDYAQQSLFPDTTYGVDSGGDPKRIPDLTYEQFKQFHETLYHPTNARIFFYGDDDPDTRLRMLHEYLREFKKLEVDSSVALQSSLEAPRFSTHTYRVDQADDDSSKSHVTLNWMLDETADPQRTLALEILSHILVETPGSPLRKALLDSGLGEDLAGRGYVDYLRQGFFSIGLKGIKAETAPQVEELVLNTLRELADQGIDSAAIEASLNTIEFRLRENNTGSFPRGLAIMIRALTTWLHDDDPLLHLAFEGPLAAIKEHLAAGEPYFENMIREAFLNNPHRTTTLLNPDPEQGPREDAQEQARLDEVRAGMSAEELQAVIERTHELKRLQETPDSPEALAMIPSLTLNDLDPNTKEIPLTHYTQADVRVLYHDLATSGITYLDIGMNLHTLPQELLPYASIFADALLELGTADEDYVRLTQRIGRKTGGLRMSSMSSMIQGSDESTVWLFLRGKATPDKTDDLLEIIRDVLLTVRLDNRERLRQIVLEEKASQEAAVAPAGHRIINMRLRSYFNEADWASEQMDGLEYLFFLRRLLDEIDNDWPAVQAKLEQVRQTLVNRSAMICNVTVDETTWRQFAPRLEAFLETLPAGPLTLVPWSPDYNPGFEGLTIPSQVNYVGKGANLYSLDFEPHGSVQVISKFLGTSWLWEQVRVRGTAYGCFCRFDRRTGILTYFSYRDPNLYDTLQVYDKTGQFLRDVRLDDEAVMRSIIGTIGDLDVYQLPDARGYTSMVRYLLGETAEQRQQWRNEILGTSAAHFRAFADVLDAMRDQAVVAVMGSGEKLNSVNVVFERSGKPMLRHLKVL